MPAANNKNGPFSEWYQSAGSSFDSDINSVVGFVLRELDRAFPGRVNLSNYSEVRERLTTYSRIWSWLESQDILSGPLTDCSLTLLSRQSFKATLATRPDLAAALSQSESGLRGALADQLMIEFLRQHYQHYMKRQEDR